MTSLLRVTQARLWVLAFDRVIVAQAVLESLPVVTSDAALVEFPAVRTLW
jgi:PIN domain nuclease of toxin-antitoxin system